jgi:hypothetical protein
MLQKVGTWAQSEGSITLGKNYGLVVHQNQFGELDRDHDVVKGSLFGFAIYEASYLSLHCIHYASLSQYCASLK